MATKSLSISIPDDLFNFLEENKQLSASKIFQSAVIILMERAKNNPELLEANKILDLKQKQNQRLQRIIGQLQDFLKNKGLEEEFNKITPI